MAVALMMRLEVLPVTVPDGDNSSPSVFKKRQEDLSLSKLPLWAHI